MAGNEKDGVCNYSHLRYAPHQEGDEVMIENAILNCYTLEGNLWLAVWELDYLVDWY